MMQSVECQFQPSSTHSDFSYDLKKPGAYITTKYFHSISPLKHYGGVVDLPYHTDLYISAIQSWIEEACEGTCQFGKQCNDIVHTYDLPSSPPIQNYHAELEMGFSKTEIKLRRLLASASNQENQAKLIHYVATLRELLAQLTGESTPGGLPSISTSQAKEYAEKIDTLAAKIGSDPLLEASECSKVSDINQIKDVPKREGKQIADEVIFASTSSTPVLRKRHIYRYNNEEQSKSQEGVTAKTESPIKLDAPSQRHIEKHRKLQEDLTDEMVGLAQQLKETSLMMNQSLLDTEKILGSTEQAVDHSLASTNNVNERAGLIYSQSFKTSCISWLIIFIMSCMFLLVVLLIRIT